MFLYIYERLLLEKELLSKEKFGGRIMELDLHNFYKNEILTEKDSDILITLGSKLSLSDAKFVNTVKAWNKF